MITPHEPVPSTSTATPPRLRHRALTALRRPVRTSVASLPVAVYPSFTLMLLLAAAVGALLLPGQHAALSQRLILAAVMMFAIAETVVLHESAHLVVAKLVDAPAYSAELAGYGAAVYIGLASPPDVVWRDVAIDLAGPAMSLLTAAAWYGLSQTPIPGFHYLGWVALVDVFMFATNVLPIFPLDGGRALAHMTAMLTASRSAGIRVARLSPLMLLLLIPALVSPWSPLHADPAFAWGAATAVLVVAIAWKVHMARARIDLYNV